MTLLIVFALVFAFLSVGLFRTQVTAIRLERLNWMDLVAKLQLVKTDGIIAVACEYLHPRDSQIGLDLSELWGMIGGVEGLARMRSNADVLIALAAQAQEWNSAEGTIVANRMRRDGLALRRAVVGIGLGSTCGFGKGRVP